MEIFKSIYDLAAVELRSRGITTISQPIVNGLGCLQLLGFDELAIQVGSRSISRTKAPLDTRLKPLPIAMCDKIRSYAELQELIRVSLRIQHPEWIEPNGDSPVCDSYEARFAELLGLSHPRKNLRSKS